MTGETRYGKQWMKELMILEALARGQSVLFCCATAKAAREFAARFPGDSTLLSFYILDEATVPAGAP